MKQNSQLPVRSNLPTRKPKKADSIASDNEINDMLQDLWITSSLLSAFAEDLSDESFIPDIDVCETAKAVIITAEIPGIKQADINLEVSNGTLTIKGEKKVNREGEDKNYPIIERCSGQFSRSLPLPGSIESKAIEAAIEDGVLTITLPKAEQENVEVKRIEVKNTKN